MAAQRPARERLWPFLGIAAIAMALFVGYMMRLTRETQTLVALEDDAEQALRGLLKSQRTFHGREGRFASAAELASSETLPDGVSGQAAAGDDPAHLNVAGYRIDVLLPVRQTPDGQVWVLPEGKGMKPHPGLLAEHIVLIARPAIIGETGWRVFYLDESDVMWASDLVSDESARRVNPLPLRHLIGGEASWDGPLSWTPLQEIVARNERDKR